MAWFNGRASDLKVRAGGAGLLLMATALLALLPAHHGPQMTQPTLVEFCLAFSAVCAGSAGASLLFVGRQMLEQVGSPGRHRGEP